MQTNGERLGQTHATVRMTVQEAAAALGVTVEAVRGRMHRGKYGREEGPGGRVFVLVPADQLPDHEPERSTERLGERSANVGSNVGSGPAEAVERLLDEVAFLRVELAVEDRSYGTFALVICRWHYVAYEFAWPGERGRSRVRGG